MRRVAVVSLVALFAYIGWRFWTVSGKTGFFEALTTEGNLIMATVTGTPASGMDVSENGLQKIAGREGFSPAKYPDASGYSIGYGHFIRPGEGFSEPMTETTAREILRRDAKIAADAVRAYVTVPLTQNQFDALTSFVYNVGGGAFRKSTLLRRLNAGDYAGAGAAFDMWHKPSIVIGRRDSEKAQFLA